jgi:cytochrome c-type biogenesis protein CcmF
VAASTSFQHSRTATIAPGQSVHLDGYTVRYVRPTATATSEKISFGAILDVSSGRQHVATLHTSYGLYPSQNPAQPIGRFFDGSTESRVGLKSGPLQDIWTVINPNVGPLQGLINQGDARFSKFVNDAMAMPAAQRTQALNELFTLRDTAIRGLAQRFVNHPWAATFLVIISPLVTWLWAGAIIAAFGGLLALWPLSPPRRRRPGARATSDDAAETVALPDELRARELV